LAASDDTTYLDAEYFLTTDTLTHTSPCFVLTTAGCRKFADALDVDFRNIERTIANQLTNQSFLLKNTCKINLQTHSNTLTVQNVIGILQGTDTTRALIIGAHYDHLGMRNKLTVRMIMLRELPECWP